MPRQTGDPDRQRCRAAGFDNSLRLRAGFSAQSYHLTTRLNIDSNCHEKHGKFCGCSYKQASRAFGNETFSARCAHRTPTLNSNGQSE